MVGRRFGRSRFRVDDSSRGGKFRKFQSSDAEGGYRGDFPNRERTWQYEPRMHGPNGHESISQWHIPPAHPDVERSKSVGRTDPSSDRRPIESDRRSTPGRRSPDMVDRDRRATLRPGSHHEVPPERSTPNPSRPGTSHEVPQERSTPNPSRPGSSHEVPQEISTPKRRDIPGEEINRNGRRRIRKRARERLEETEWPEGELPPNEKIYAEQQLLELKPIPVYHLNESIPRRDVDQSRHQFFPDVPEDVQESPSESIVMVIIDQTSPNHELGKDHAMLVENKLTKKLLKAVKMGTSVQFETQEYDGKFLRFACANQETCDWLTSAVGNIGKLWEGASLAVVPEQDIPKFTQVKAFIPGKDISQETCQNTLAVQNPKLDIHKWVLWKCKENKEAKGFDLVFGVPEDLLPKVSAVQGKAYYMFSKIILKIVREEGE